MSTLIGLALLVFDVIVILDIFKQSWDPGKKIVWTLLIIIFPLLGALVYWFIARK